MRSLFLIAALVIASPSTAQSSKKPDAQAVAFLTGLHDAEGMVASLVRNKDFDGLRRQLPRIRGNVSRLQWTSSMGQPAEARCVVAQGAMMGLLTTLSQQSPTSEAILFEMTEWGRRVSECEQAVGRTQMATMRVRP